MTPVRKAAVISLLEWVRRMRPDVRSISSLDKAAFMQIVTDFEISKGVYAINDPKSNLRTKWKLAHGQLNGYASDVEALNNYR